MKKNKCYANILGNCDNKISHEHFISKKIFELLTGKIFNLSGAAWLSKDKQIQLTVSNLNSKVLCRKHNSQLSNVDSYAANFFETIYKYTRGGIQGSVDVSNLPSEFNGRDLEYWMLKVACGAIASGNWGGENRIVPAEWNKILFRNQEWPDCFSLYSTEKTGYTVPANDHMRFDFRRDPQNKYLQGVTCHFMCYDMTLALGNFIGIPGIKRPSELLFKHDGRELSIKIKW